MPQYVIERDVPGVHLLTEAEVRAVAQKSVEALTSLGPQIQWVQSYVTENKIYCVYLAPDEAIIREHARRAGVLGGDRAMRERWWDALGLGSSEFWRLWTGGWSDPRPAARPR